MKQNIPYVLRDTVTYKPFDWQSIMKMEPNVLSSGQPSGSVNTISLSRVVSDIHEYGIGYSDVISIIAFPLIIALFAFAFPFMFDRINQINSKYGSPVIAKLFSGSWQYVFFWIMNIVAVVYMLLAGGITLFCPKSVYVNCEEIFNWLSWGVASLYAISVLLFAKIGVLFNKPDRLPELINSRHKYDVWTVKWLVTKLWLRYAARYWRHPKDKAGQQKFKSIINANKLSNNRFPNSQMLSRYIELAKFAIRENMPSLYTTIQNEALKETFEKEKHAVSTWFGRKDSEDSIQESAVHYSAMDFFNQITKEYKPFNHYAYSDDTIIYSMLGVFNKSMYMSYGDTFDLAICMRNMIDGKKLTLVESYINHSRYYFTYINRLPQLLYIKGGDMAKRPSVEEKSEENWNQLCNFHFLMAAYAYNNDVISILPSLMDKDHPWEYQLYPISHADILLRYADCKANIKVHMIDKLFERRVDYDVILDRYVCALFMLTEKSDKDRVTISITPERIKVIEDNKSNILKYENSVKDDSRLYKFSPNIKSFGIVQNFDKTVTELKAADKWYREEPVEQPSFLQILNFLFPSANGQTKRIEFDAYAEPLKEAVKHTFEQKFNNIENDLYRHLSTHLFVNVSEQQNKTINIGACQLLVDRMYYLDEQFSEGYFGLYSKMVELIATRIAYMTLTAFSEMKIDEVDVTSVDFDLFFNNYVGKNKSDYVLVDVDSPFDALLDVHFKGYERDYKDVPFISLNSASRIGHMSELPSFEKFKGSLLIIAKKDLPSLVCDNETPVFDYKDESAKEKMKLRIRTTVDIQRQLKYKSTGSVMKVNCKRLSF